MLAEDRDNLRRKAASHDGDGKYMRGGTESWEALVLNGELSLRNCPITGFLLCMEKKMDKINSAPVTQQDMHEVPESQG